jgi:hypothetical protein
VYRDDIASDFSVFHRIRDIGAMGSREFLRLASRIGVYNGAVTAKARHDRQGKPQQQARQPAQPARRSPLAPAGSADGDAVPASSKTVGTVADKLNQAMGAQWISHRVVAADGEVSSG